MNRILKRVCETYISNLPKIYAVEYENRFDKSITGAFIFQEKKDAEYLYAIANHAEARANSMGNTQGNIKPLDHDVFDYGLIKINKMCKKAIQVKEHSQILNIEGQFYNVEKIGCKKIYTYFKEDNGRMKTASFKSNLRKMAKKTLRVKLCENQFLEEVCYQIIEDIQDRLFEEHEFEEVSMSQIKSILNNLISEKYEDMLMSEGFDYLDISDIINARLTEVRDEHNESIDEDLMPTAKKKSKLRKSAYKYEPDDFDGFRSNSHYDSQEYQSGKADADSAMMEGLEDAMPGFGAFVRKHGKWLAKNADMVQAFFNHNLDKKF